MQNYYTTISKLLTNKFGVDPSDINPDAEFEADLNIGPMELSELIEHLEAKYNFSFNDEDEEIDLGLDYDTDEEDDTHYDSDVDEEDDDDPVHVDTDTNEGGTYTPRAGKAAVYDTSEIVTINDLVEVLAEKLE
ncbi:MAG: hypothetical protein R3B92_00700 [Patescibacteria group bacterium]|uniref:Carrier domain-containing protein n=1 Tax=candidate division WWE3 bacterium TaxID=2053526 RepID=A0A955EB83_UNCKA|nr:hypothetical protein [candidate division WWE3 bacterium]